MRRRKVIQVTPYYPPHIGGVERVAQALARGLDPHYDVEVWTSDVGGGGTPTETFPVRRLRSIEVAHTPVPFALLPRLLTLGADSVVHVHIAQAVWPELVMCAASIRRFAVVAHFHLDVDPSGRAGLLLPLYKRHLLGRVLRRADLVIALTPEQVTHIADTYSVAPERLVVLVNGVDDALFAPSPGDEHQGVALRILFVGRIESQKNVPRLVRAIARTEADVELAVVGDGSERAECEALAASLGLRNVRFLGATFGEELLCWYRWADVFALSSDREGMPLALLEAMAAGLPTVVTDVSDLANQVGAGGLVVPPDEVGLAGAFDTLARDRVLVRDLAAASRAHGERFSWSSSVEELCRLYDGLSPTAVAR
jgi:glycosyltransferase involved in cell wall biosynthesis